MISAAPTNLSAVPLSRDLSAVPLSRVHQNGCTLLRGAIAPEYLDKLRSAFDAGVKASHEWAAPRGPGWRHSLLDLDSTVQAVCRLPGLLQAVGELIGERFFLGQVEGREPLLGGGHQPLHRDCFTQRPGDTVSALAYFDDYGPENGATRIIPGSHRPSLDDPLVDCRDEAAAIQLSGHAGDVFVFDSDLVHAGSNNPSGGRRRSILITYFAEPCYALRLKSAQIRNVRMDTSERFNPVRS